jgi:hypothetical protein
MSDEELRARHEDELRSRPLSKEDAYFRKVEEERLKAIELRKAEKRLVCPHDQTPLVHENRHGIVVDACPSCKGIWLDDHEAELLRHVMQKETEHGESLWKRVMKNLLPYQDR